MLFVSLMMFPVSSVVGVRAGSQYGLDNEALEGEQLEMLGHTDRSFIFPAMNGSCLRL